MDDKVKVRCPFCTKLFNERAQKVRDGHQVDCRHCVRLVTFTKDTEDPFMRRALKAAREVRAVIDAEKLARLRATSGHSRA